MGDWFVWCVEEARQQRRRADRAAVVGQVKSTLGKLVPWGRRAKKEIVEAGNEFVETGNEVVKSALSSDPAMPKMLPVPLVKSLSRPIVPIPARMIPIRITLP